MKSVDEREELFHSIKAKRKRLKKLRKEADQLELLIEREMMALEG